jgi:transcriptional regulator of arginine metabolism
MKSFRQAAILDLVDSTAVPNQEVLRQRLRQRGFDATQATLSRDIKELGLVKRASDGAYQRAGHEAPARADGAEAGFRRAVGEYLRRVDQVQQLVVLKTDAGQAPVLAIAIDRGQLPEVVGTIAGDDTILVIARDERRAASFARRVENLARS